MPSVTDFYPPSLTWGPCPHFHLSRMHYKKNFRLLVSKSGCHAHSTWPSPSLLTSISTLLSSPLPAMPCLIHNSFIVNLGPSSWSPTFSTNNESWSQRGGSPSLKTYRCRRKKMKSLWLCSVTTCLPWNWGCFGKRHWKNLATRTPNLVVKLFKINSGKCVVAFPWPAILWHVWTLDTRNRQDGPEGRWIRVIASIFLRAFSSLMTSKSVNPLSAAPEASFWSVRYVRPRGRNVEPGKTLRRSAAKVWVGPEREGW
jgi:hypothetical protein